MNTLEQNMRWANIIAEAIDENLAYYESGDIDSITFVSDMAAKEPQLYNPANVYDRNLSAAWNFADSFFDAAKQNLESVDTFSMLDATERLKQVSISLKAGVPLEDIDVLSYSR